MKYVLVLAVILVALVGCGKQVAKCDDPVVSKSLESILLSKYTEYGVEQSKKLSGLLDGSMFEVKASRVDVAPSLSGFATQKVDKESGTTTCVAFNNSKPVVTIEIGLRGNEKVDPIYEYSLLTAFNKDMELDASIFHKVEGNRVVVSVGINVEKKVTYTTQRPDNGEGVLVYIEK